MPGAIFDTERWSTSGFSYGVPNVPAGTQVFVRLFLGNGFADTSQPGQRVFDITVDGTIVQNDFDMIPAFGHEVGGMLEYLVTSDGTVDIGFVFEGPQNPLVNGIEVVSASSSPGQLGVSPTTVDFGATLVNSSKDATVTLSNLGFEVGDPAITVTSVVPSGGEFSTNFSSPAVVGAGGSTAFDVTFSPTSVGAQAQTLTITHSGTNSPLIVNLDGVGSNNIPVSFSSAGLSGESSNNPTSLQFGPDGRLYVAQQDGTIKAYTVQRNSANDYAVTATETINLIKTDTTNHNDDGSTNPSTIAPGDRHSGHRHGGEPSDLCHLVGLRGSRSATTRVSTRTPEWSADSPGTAPRWDKVDIVRGLPRSEENHSTNGMDLDEATNTLYVMPRRPRQQGCAGQQLLGHARVLPVGRSAVGRPRRHQCPRHLHRSLATAPRWPTTCARSMTRPGPTSPTRMPTSRTRSATRCTTPRSTWATRSAATTA